MSRATARSTTSSDWSQRNTMPGNVCSTVICAPSVTPSDSSRSSSSAADTTNPCSPSDNDASGRMPLELNAKEMKDIVQPHACANCDRRDHAGDGQPGPHPALADHHEKVGDARHEKRHHRERDDGLHA